MYTAHTLGSVDTWILLAGLSHSRAFIHTRTSTLFGHLTTHHRHWTLTIGALSGELAEQLRLILEPTLASRLQGDFRTGKRLNMRKIIPYIASDFRKDKIWLRRSRPSQRKYQARG